MRTKRVVLAAFDGSLRQATFEQETELWRELENRSLAGPRIARGGGFSYAPLSMGEGVVSQSVTRFDRILAFDAHQKRIVVEPGIKLGELFRFTAPHGLYLSVQPGYPAITVGGCVGSNVHGKNPYTEGTFEGRVEALTLFHPSHGSLQLSRTEHPELFDLTCGGLGLTGIITSVTLRLSELKGHRARMEYHPIESLPDGYGRLLDACQRHDVAYTWHSGYTRLGRFGRGYLICGSIHRGRAPLPEEIPQSFPLGASTRGSGYPAVWNRVSSAVVDRWYLPMTGRRPEREFEVFQALFPLYGRELYFQLFGRRGFFEYQVLVAHDRAIAFLEALTDLLVSAKAPTLFVALRMFRGRPRYLRFDGDGVTVAFDMPRTPMTTRLMERLNRLMLDYAGVPFVVKNSSLTRSVVQEAFPDYQQFRDRLHEFDPERLFRSRHSEQLGL